MKILCVDFDGVIHSFRQPFAGPTVIPDPPVPGALRWLYESTEFFDTCIYSARSSELKSRIAMYDWMKYWSRLEFGDEHPMSRATMAYYPVRFADKKPQAFLIIDDRAIQFRGDFKELDFETLAQFKPWNKR